MFQALPRGWSAGGGDGRLAAAASAAATMTIVRDTLRQRECHDQTRRENPAWSHQCIMCGPHARFRRMLVCDRQRAGPDRLAGRDARAAGDCHGPGPEPDTLLGFRSSLDRANRKTSDPSPTEERFGAARRNALGSTALAGGTQRETQETWNRRMPGLNSRFKFAYPTRMPRPDPVAG